MIWIDHFALIIVLCNMVKLSIFYFNLSIIVLRIWIAISIPKAISSVYTKEKAFASKPSTLCQIYREKPIMAKDIWLLVLMIFFFCNYVLMLERMYRKTCVSLNENSIFCCVDEIGNCWNWRKLNVIQSFV